MIDLTNLNDEQKKAVEIVDGPLLVLAGAGSGKTKVLTTRIAYLIENENVSPYNILAITFTNKAAKEMQERVIKLVGEYAKNMQISTFHSFGLRIIRENYDKLGYDRNFVIMDSDDSLTVVKKILKDFDIDTKQFNPNAIRNKISSCKNELVTPKDYERFASSEFEKIVLKVYERYEYTLKTNNSVDFDDLLILPIKLFRENEDILDKYQERFKYILVDEYQDTNHAQYILTKLLASKYRNICVVGDENQSIYSFRGANYRNILNFEKDYNETKTIKLEQNYRSTTNVLDAANEVIQNNKSRKDKNLWSDKGKGDKITYYRSYDEKDEAHYVVSKIKELVKSGCSLDEIAVLYRTNAQSRILEEEMLKENINYRVVGSFYFYNRREIKDLMAYLRLIHNPKDNVSLMRIINSPKRGIGLKTIANLNEKADLENKSIYEIIDSGKELEFKNVIEDLRKVSENITLTELIDKILDTTGYREELEHENTLESDIRLENLEEFKSITRSFEDREGVISLEDFLFEVSLVSDRDEYQDSSDKVSLMTVHAVKGLEFDDVFVVGLEEGIFPHMNSLMESSELEEERRLMYVAITRARERLYLINARRRMLYGKDSINPPSRFIGEIDKEHIDTNMPSDDNKVFEKVEKEDNYYDEDVEFKVGDYVNHTVFGNGKVVDVTNTLVSVAFKMPHGIKKLLKNHKSLKKI